VAVLVDAGLGTDALRDGRGAVDRCPSTPAARIRVAVGVLNKD
jgi:hypothetical protein